MLIPPARASVLMFVVGALFAGPSRAADDAALLKDLTAVVLLLGLPCDQMVSARRQADNDHVVACRDGNRYRISVNAEGRVVAQKL